MDGDLVLDEGNHAAAVYREYPGKNGIDRTRREGPKLGRVIGLTPGQSFKVLVVDDNEESRFFSSRRCRDRRFRVREAVDGKEAVEKYMRWSPDIILMDMRMPGTSGYRRPFA
jgi:PleD family two-component response regulator